MEFNYFFNNESSYCYTNYGTDEFMVAGDNSNQMWNDYDARLGSVVTPAVNSNTQAINILGHSVLLDSALQYDHFQSRGRGRHSLRK